MNNIETLRDEEQDRHSETMASLDLVERTGIGESVSHVSQRNIYLNYMDTIAEAIQVLDKIGRYEMTTYYYSMGRLALQYRIKAEGVDVTAYVPLECLATVGPNCKIIERPTMDRSIVCDIKEN